MAANTFRCRCVETMLIVFVIGATVVASEPNRVIDVTLDTTGFGEGWKARVSYPVVPGITDDAKCDLWIDQGWLHARRLDSADAVWQVVLAKVENGVFPTVRTIKNSPSLHLSYADGRYFIRDNSLVLRALRQHTANKRPTFTARDVLSEEVNVGRLVGYSSGFERFVTGRFIHGGTDKKWFCATSGPSRTAMDCFIRLNRGELYDVGSTVFGGSQGFSGMSDGLLNAYYGAQSVSDDGIMLIAYYNVPLLAQKQVNQKRIRSNLADGRPPEIMGSKWLNSEPLHWDQLRGKVVVVDFWATWCAPCVKRLSAMQELADKFADEGLVVIGIHSAQDGDTCEDFVKKKELTFPIAIDTGKTEERFGIDGFPSYFLINRKGEIVDGYRTSPPDEIAIRHYLDTKDL